MESFLPIHVSALLFFFPDKLPKPPMLPLEESVKGLDDLPSFLVKEQN
ncbi:hypothetical protein SLEP1_g18172 [Rubroshorea leprosula]|uniref:Uncharacterized protein n=1 Tax=Rubroshorea leprosula TaxID=152421 RepID=A0AAV5IWQ0_9ROSI|nr:hypothetical protein SLEP1_g18172 [Rubroshorea leprosula]